MPTYEYLCASGHRYEKRESFSAPSRQRCPTCRKTADRVLYAPPIVFKGSGFYATDNRGSNGASETSSTSPAAADASSHGHSHADGGHSHPHGDTTETAAAS